MSCECGAYKVYGAGYGEVGHSRWCPDSGIARDEKTPTICSGITTNGYCFAGSTHWIQYSLNGPVFHYCENCYNDAQAAAIYGTGIYRCGVL
jgi:hypothetical protein